MIEPDEPAPVRVQHEDGRSDLLLTADHAGRAIPRMLGRLGLPESELSRHIAWDIGIAGVTERLSAALDATAVLQTYSRLVIDCNRDPAVPSSIPEVSETTEIPGNRGLSAEQRAARRDAIFEPYHARIAGAAGRAAGGGPAHCICRDAQFHAGVQGRVARPCRSACCTTAMYGWRDLLDLLRAEGDLTVGDNAPYAVSDVTDYSVPVHAERRGLPHVEIEIRQDLIADERARPRGRRGSSDCCQRRWRVCHAEPRGADRSGPCGAAVRRCAELQRAARWRRICRDDRGRTRRAIWVFLPHDARDRAAEHAAAAGGVPMRGIEVMYTVIEALTRDGRDLSLDYKISGLFVPRGSWDAKVLDAIAPGEDEIVLPKTSSSVFISTNIDYVLRNLGVRSLMIAGVLTDQCIDSAVRDACDLGYLVTADRRLRHTERGTPRVGTAQQPWILQADHDGRVGAGDRQPSRFACLCEVRATRRSLSHCAHQPGHCFLLRS